MATISTSSSRPYHIIVFGASGFTGQFVVEEVARTTAEGPAGTLKWAIAGRSRPKLEKVLDQAAGALSKPELKSEVEIIVADVGEEESLAAMCKQGVIVLNCVGPYRFYGEPVVKACVENGTHCIDICGEPQGGCIHDGTWQSAIYGFADSAKLRSLRKKSALFFSKEIDQYAVPFMGADPSVVKRTQRYLHEEHQESPVQYGAYAGVGGIASVVKLLFAGMLFWFMVKFSFGRNLLIKFPELFSFGVFSKEGPTKKQMENSSFCFTFFGEGYAEGQDPMQGKPNAKIRTQAGYVATPIAMVQAAITLLNEPKSLPKTGGVYSPGAAFAKTTLVDRLNKHGFQFSVVTGPEA
ncbi:hypothetical protein JZ751_010462 [Albula glossodonta]|uniref:Saccharopine dehydrogenase-like oxidoreductase n=1 Tax=Albula glossodonta TaxID=121402 RepID=A0A8T2NWQ6_9TELE|nr:hypothetical protein JZ751_010462 [Albula glossodonta]